tara:strand:+ start:20 stop:826 length:807 start_codon:yes stop_codon:yes gene_type:complete
MKKNKIKDLINFSNLNRSLKNFRGNFPFDFTVCDNFFNKEIAKRLEKEFPKYESNLWHIYKNPLEIKKTNNNWNNFEELTYLTFHHLNSDFFIKYLSEKTKNNKLISDSGLNGGGLHIHGSGGKLNPHLDYNIHPKLNFQRKINIIIFLTNNWKKTWGGSLGLWSNDKKNKLPKKLEQTIYPKFNRAIIFDTTQNSWHGLSNKIACPKNVFRKSIAIYYLQKINKINDNRTKALFAPTEDQKKDKKILNLIKKRSSNKNFNKAYISKN